LISLIQYYFDHNKTNKSKCGSYFVNSHGRKKNHFAEASDGEITHHHAMIINGFLSLLLQQKYIVQIN